MRGGRIRKLFLQESSAFVNQGNSRLFNGGACNMPSRAANISICDEVRQSKLSSKCTTRRNATHLLVSYMHLLKAQSIAQNILVK